MIEVGERAEKRNQACRQIFVTYISYILGGGLHKQEALLLFITTGILERGHPNARLNV